MAALRAPRRADQAGRASITKGVADKALRELEGPTTSPTEKAKTVQRFLDSQDASALSPKAREALLAFVKQQGRPAAGGRIAEVRSQTSASSGQQPQTQARGRLLTLLKAGSTPTEARERFAKIASWLDAAEADMALAGARLAGLAAGGAAKVAGTAAHRQAHQELDALLKGPSARDVRPGEVETVRRWLSSPPVRPDRVAALRGAFQRLDQAGTLSWTPGGVREHHLGVRFARVELLREPRSDGFTFTAYLPIGALTPGAPAKDPNQVAELYVERSGGYAGLTFSVGPIRVGGDQ